jgi:hypothetical protein
VKEVGFRGIEILRGHVRRQGPPAKRDRPSPRIFDRKHDAVAETVKGNRNILTEDDKAACLDLLFGRTFLREMLLQGVTAVRRVAQAKLLLGRARKAPVAQISPRLCASGKLQLAFEEDDRHLHDVVQRGAYFLAALRFRIAFGHRHAGEIGNLLHRLRKGHTFQFGQEAEVITLHAAAEAVIAALLVLAVETRRFLAVERAARPSSRRATRSSCACPTPRVCRSRPRWERDRGFRRGKIAENASSAFSGFCPSIQGPTDPRPRMPACFPAIHRSYAKGTSELRVFQESRHPWRHCSWCGRIRCRSGAGFTQRIIPSI